MNYLIDFNNNASPEQIQQYLLANNCEIIKNYQHFDKIYHVKTPNLSLPKTDIVDFIQNDDEMVLNLLNSNVISSDEIVDNLNIEDEKNWWKIYSLFKVDFDQTTLNLTRQGRKTIVYILDSGIDKNHAEFNGVDVKQIYSVVDNFEDMTGHGTGIASIISGNTCGINRSTLGICKIFDPAHQTKQSELLTAFEKVLDDFQTTTLHGIVNLSWCIPRNTYIEDKIRLLRSKGLQVVVAAGNSGQPIGDVTPAAMNDVLTIGSYNKNFEPSNFSDYSDSSVSLTNNLTNHGELDGWAPGEQIWAAVPGGTYSYSAGTSMACAVHSAVLAYNLDKYYLENETLKCMDFSQLQIISNMSLGRENILNLSDEKYQNSVNKISTVENRPHLGWLRQILDNNVIPRPFPVRVGQVDCARLFDPSVVSNLEILDPLPPGFYIENGWLVGDHNESITEPYVLLGDFRIRLTLSENNDQHEILIKISLLQPDLEKESLPSDDPNIDILFLALCGGTSQCASKTCQALSEGCCTIVGKTVFCMCVFGSCP